MYNSEKWGLFTFGLLGYWAWRNGHTRLTGGTVVIRLYGFESRLPSPFQTRSPRSSWGCLSRDLKLISPRYG